jgi:hypothetical protein
MLQYMQDKPINEKEGFITMKGQVLLGGIVLASVGIGVILFIFTQLKPPQLTPLEYTKKVLQGKPSQEAQQVTKKILEQVGKTPNESADVSSGAGYIISYTAPTEHAPWPDYWIEITATTPEAISAAKQAAEKWLLDQGYSKEDLCSGGIPVHFYLSKEASKALAEAGKEARISPYPSFCR